MADIITTRDIARHRHKPQPASDAITTSSPRPAKPEQRIIYKMVHSLLGKNAWADAPRVWIIGGGPSLRDFDWSLLAGEVVLGCNRCYERPNVGATICIDGANSAGFLNWAEMGKFGDSWRNYTGLKIYSQLEQKHDGVPEDVYVVDRMRTQGRDLILEKGLPQTNNTGTLAVQFAAALGAKDIRLLGFDMGSPGEKQEHHHDGYPREQKADVCNGMIPEFNKLAPDLSLMGVHVTLYGPSKLKCFDKKPLADAVAELQKKPTRPLVVGAVTPSYIREAEEMMRTARAMGFEAIVDAYEDRGDWYLNTHYKPVFMKRMLETHKRPILWLDADARIRKYPKAFDNLKADIGWVWWDWEKCGGIAKELELSTGMLYLRPKADVYRLLDAWQQANEENPKEHDQTNLQRLLDDGFRRGRLKAKQLPMSYSQIFDLQRSLGEPVIEQMQASRRFK